MTHPDYEEINLSSTGKFENEFLVLTNPIIQHVGDGTLLFRAQSRANKASWRVSHHLNAAQPTSNASQIYPHHRSHPSQLWISSHKKYPA